MDEALNRFGQLSYDQLVGEIKRLVGAERCATAELIRGLMEVDARRSYLHLGYSSLFAFCTQALYLSEHAAYGRIEAVRAARKFPVLLDRLTDGSLNLTAVGLLSRYLTQQNHCEVLDAACHKTKRQIEEMVAALAPKPAAPTIIRKVSQGATGSLTTLVECPAAPETATPPATPLAVIRPLAPEAYKIQFTVSRETHDKLRKAQDLLRHTNRTGDPAAIFDRALTLLLEHLEKKRLALTNKPRANSEASARSRHVPAGVKRAVWKRDEGRCAFVGTDGRCTERALLEFHHVEPFALGGEATVQNIQLRCRAHNAFEADLAFSEGLPLLCRDEAAAFA